MRARSIFTDKSPVVVPANEQDLGWIPIILISDVFCTLIEEQAKFGSYETGSVKTLPLPSHAIRESGPEWNQLYAMIDKTEYGDETSWLYCSVLHCDTNRAQQMTAALTQIDVNLAKYGLSVSPVARQLMAEDIARWEWKPHIDRLSATIGYAFGRWDIRVPLGEREPACPSGPFDALPNWPPGSLLSPDGRPASKTPEGYPIGIPWDGILVDGAGHPNDIVDRARCVIELIWKEHPELVEQASCELLRVSDLREYFRKTGPGGFWDHHVGQYTKSRRKAPIYWLLQSSKRSYGLWIYYQRLDKDILFKALLNYVEPKIRREEARLDELRSQKSALGPASKGSRQLDKDIDRQEAFLSELRDFEDKLRRAANLHLDPDLNDGVVLNIAPLRELVPWKEAKNYWEALLEGKYEWSSIGKQLREKGLIQ